MSTLEWAIDDSQPVTATDKNVTPSGQFPPLRRTRVNEFQRGLILHSALGSGERFARRELVVSLAFIFLLCLLFYLSETHCQAHDGVAFTGRTFFFFGPTVFSSYAGRDREVACVYALLPFVFRYMLPHTRVYIIQQHGRGVDAEEGKHLTS